MSDSPHGPLQVFVLAPTGRDAPLTCAMLGEGGVRATAMPTMGELCAAVSDSAAALLVAEEALTAAAVRALSSVLDAQPPWSDIPVIVLAGAQFSESALRPLNVLGSLRNVMVLERPVRRMILMRTVAVAVRARLRQLELRRYLDERTELLRREQIARHQAETASRMKDEFLMTVSHELRTPLTAIYGWARMLVTGQIHPQQRQRALETIERNARAQTQLVDDLLDVSRAISGKVRLDIRPVNVADVIRAAVESMQPAASARNIHLPTVIDPAAGWISADRERLQQIIWNLLSNAIKFTSMGGTVQTRLHQHAEQVEIVVSDTGIGIAPEFLPFVFDRFRQEEPGTTRQHGGLGLGLAIVRHLTELHGGRVAVESEGPGSGATFRVFLPLTAKAADAPPANDAVAVPQAFAAASSSRLDGLRVLVVDDEPQARELFGLIVENAGADVRLSGSASEAVDVVHTWSPDVLVSDIEMPREDGYGLIARVRNDDGLDGTRLPAIAVTAHSRAEDRLKALEAGFQYHLAKPVEPTELVAAIASLVARRTA
jgi:signal transduction histidine kinase/ActR/RegA family two-component response regulator